MTWPLLTLPLAFLTNLHTEEDGIQFHLHRVFPLPSNHCGFASLFPLSRTQHTCCLRHFILWETFPDDSLPFDYFRELSTPGHAAHIYFYHNNCHSALQHLVELSASPVRLQIFIFILIVLLSGHNS